MDTVQGKSLQNFSAYVATRCTTCDAGWTRKDEGGKVVIVCLLNREPVWPEMVHCDRFEAKDDRPARL